MRYTRIFLHSCSSWILQRVAVVAILVLLASTVHVAMPATVVAQTNVSVAFAASTYSVNEGSPVDVEIELGTAATSSVTVRMMTTAQGGADQDDFSLSATSVTFNPGEDSKTVTFTAEDDDVHFEAGETVKLSFATFPNGFEVGSVAETVVTLVDTNDPTTDDLDHLDVVWDSPSADSWGSMPIGNGNIGLNVWVENSSDRDLVFYLATGDAYDWMGELLKLGRIRVSMDPNPFASGATFSQRLRLRDGQIEISSSTSSVSVDLRIWVDKNNPVVHINGTSTTDVNIDVELELWRTSERTLSGNEIPRNWQNAQDSNNSFVTAKRYTDTIVADSAVTDKVIWYHRNTASTYDFILETDEIEEYTDGEDPLMNRTFGAAILGTGMTKTSNNKGLEVNSVRDIDISVYPYTAQTDTVSAWRTGLQASIDAVGTTSYSERYEAHKSWWRSFWNRHWIMVSAEGSDAADAEMITQHYALVRFVLATASDGEASAHFNGLIYTVDVNKRLPHHFISSLGNSSMRYDADYRTWGSFHWFQNIRFAYWPMLVAGDAEHMHSLFDMYIDALPLAQYRTDTYYDHDGAYFPETITMWGSHAPRDYGTEDARGDNPSGWLVQPHKRYHREANIELALMMLYYHDITQNDDWWTKKGLPFIHEIVTFFREHYSEAGGPIRITPSQGLETLRPDTERPVAPIVNPTDKVTGLHFILDKLLALPEELSTEAQRTYWHGMKSSMPLIQKTVHNNKETIASSESHSRPRQKKENVDLYATFPFPIYGVGKPDLQLARNTFDERRSNDMGGWNQQPVHAAMVGDLADAKNFTTRYFREKEMWGPNTPISQTAFRFPVFYGPSHDYIPNVPQMGNAMIALQTMLVRYEGRRIILFPTWPDEWDVKFRVHLPYQTVLQGELEDGEVVSMKATPSDRLEDIDYIHFEPTVSHIPEVSLSAPAGGGVFGWGEAVAFTVAVTDTDSGGDPVEVDCADVSVVVQLVRNGTATDESTRSSCSGTVMVVAEPSGAADDELLYRLVASYSDADSLTGTAEVTLHPRRKQAEHFDFGSGVAADARTPSA